jgi:hypothetical protein
VTLVDRPARRWVDVLLESAVLLESRAMIVAGEAERAEGTEPKGPPIISMGRMVIGHLGGGHFAGGEAFFAKRLHNAQLMRAAALPEARVVPSRGRQIGPIVPSHAAT